MNTIIMVAGCVAMAVAYGHGVKDKWRGGERGLAAALTIISLSWAVAGVVSCL